MKKTNGISRTFYLLIIALLFINSCSKDDTISTGSGLMTTISGMVTDENNTPMSNVTVSASGQTVVTDQNGIFVLKNLNVNKDRCIMQFSKTGFFNRTHAFIASKNSVNYVRIVLISNAQTQTVAAASGGTVTLTDNSSVEFSPNSFITASGNSYNGTVRVTLKHLSPDNVNFGFSIPGGDLRGKDANDNEVVLYSYGMLGVLLTGTNGETLQLANGSAATLTMPVANLQAGTAPSIIPLWYFDEEASLWKQQGTATKIGNNYVGNVSHFSWWNCDYQGPRATITGKVVGCNGIPAANVNVTVNDWYVMTTDQNGMYQSDVPVGMIFTIQVLSSDNSGILQDSQVENIPVLTAGQIFNVPDLEISLCPTRVTGTISGCNGSQVNAIVFVTWNGGVNFQYCTTGSFTIAVNSNSTVTIKIYEGSETRIKTIIAGSPESQSDIGNTVLCNNGIQPDNSYYIDGDGFNHELIQIDTTVTFAADNSSQRLRIYISGFNNSTGQTAYTIFNINDSLPGNYSCNSSSMNYMTLGLDNKSYISFIQNAQATVTVSEVQYIGGRVIGTFAGTLARSDTAFANSVTISSGKFNVTRTQ